MGLIDLLWAVNISIKIMHFTVCFSSSFSRPPKWTTTSFPRKDLQCQEKISAKVLAALCRGCSQFCGVILSNPVLHFCYSYHVLQNHQRQDSEHIFSPSKRTKAFRRRSLYLRLKCSLKWPKGTWMWKHGWHSRHCWRIGWKELQKKKRCLCHRMTWTIMEVGAKPGTYKNITVLNKCHSENT